MALISGAGRTLQNLIAVIGRGELDLEITGVVSSKADVYGLTIAKEAGIPCRTVLPRNYGTREDFSDATYAAIARFQPDLVLMCGYLRQLGMPPGWEDRVLNIHPSLLPETLTYAAGKGKYGIAVHRAVLEHGDTVSGATVHVVTEVYDSGPPLLRREVPVLPDDTPESLADRVFAVEKELFPEAIRRYTAANPHLKRVQADSRR